MNVSRIGIIGLGKHGQRYARHIREDFPGLRLAAISRSDPERLAADAEATGAQGFADFRELLESGTCDAIIAVVPPHLNLEIVAGCCAAGLPLLLEKPAAPDLESARRMYELSRRAEVPIMVAQTLRYSSVVRALRANLPSVGRVTSISLTQRFEASVLDWLDDPARSGAGIALHTGVHCFDLIRHLTGKRVLRVGAQVERIQTSRTEDSCAATLALEDGILATVSLARTTGGRTGHIELSGDEGTLAGDHVLNRAHLVRGREAFDLPVGDALPTVREIIGDFVECIDRGLQVSIPLSDGLEAVAVAVACLEAARSGRVAEVPRIG